MTHRIKHVEFNGNTLITSNIGIRKSTSASAPLTLAGLPRCLDLLLALNGVGGDVLLSNVTGSTNKGCAYRVLWGIRDANNNLIYGAPSNRAIIYNSVVAPSTRDVNITIRIPSEITTSHFYQVYRTTIIPNVDTTDPGDVMCLVYENNPTSAEITAGVITYRDIVPDIVRGDELYTNANQEGIENANERPPLARDLVEFRGLIGYANYTDPHRMTIQLIGASGLTAATSKVTIGGVQYNCEAAETIASGNFQKVTTGTAAQQIEGTAQSLCRVINGYAANTGYYAYYVSTDTTLPGTILIEERGVGGSAISVTCNSTATGASFSPPLPTSGTTYSSTAERRKNRIRWSKPDEPEAVPLYRDTIVGAQDDEIQRVIKLRDFVIVVKDKTVWRITGSVFEDFVATLLDDTTSCAGRDSYAKLNNTVFGLSNQGFVAITDNGVQLVGRPEEHRIVPALDVMQSPNHDFFVADACEQQRVYICRMVESIDTQTPFVYCYNAITRAWTTWLINPNCISVQSDRFVYGIDSPYGNVMLQRNGLRDNGTHTDSRLDYREEECSITGTSSGAVFTGAITYPVDYNGVYDAAVDEGWTIESGGRIYSVLSAADAGGGNTALTLDRTGLANGTYTLNRPVPMTVEWQPRRAGNPGELKQWGLLTLKCETAVARKVSFTFATEIDQKEEPYIQDWEGTVYGESLSEPVLARQVADDAYVSSDGKPATETRNDCLMLFAPERVVPNNAIKINVPPDCSQGEHLSVRVSNSQASSRFGIKSLVVETRALNTTRGRQ